MSRSDHANMCRTSAAATHEPVSAGSGKRREQLTNLSVELLGGDE